MELSDLIAALSSPSAHRPGVATVEVVQTHISAVFLTHDLVYKVKKPVDLGFLDFTTLELREHFCREEIRLNRRLAPNVYLGLAPVLEEEGRVRFGRIIETDGPADPPVGRIIDWAVVMRRLPPDLTMESWVLDGSIRPYHVAVLGRRIAHFHDQADSGAAVSDWGRFDVVAGNALENLDQSQGHIVDDPAGGHGPLTRELHERLQASLERQLVRLRPLIESRAAAGYPRDTHGDLHLDHVYVFADRDPPEDVVIIDCIEFNERFRFADPVSDVAFLDMDLRYHGREDLAEVLTDAYFEASEDEEGRGVLRFYSAYRSAVRAKVAGMRALEPEVPAAEREQSVESACAHWLLALGLLEPPDRRPVLVLVGGLPGTGKSTLAGAVGEQASVEVLSSDVVRKRLAGLDPRASAAADFGAGIYSEEWNERTYEELLAQAEDQLRRGGRVLIDASFRDDRRRCEFLELAARLRVRAVFLQLEAPRQRIRDRILARRGGVSDADVDVYEQAARLWEPSSEVSLPHTRVVDTGQTPAWSLEQSLTALRALGALS